MLCVFKGGTPLTIPGTFGHWKHVDLKQFSIQSPTDDWPYLYLHERTIPSDYLFVIVSLLVASTVALIAIRGISVGATDMHFFFLGIGFLLLQTKSITDCSLYFGATWLVTTIVIAGVLTMVILANLFASRLKRTGLWLYIPLTIALLIVHFTSRDAILALPFSLRLAWGMIIVPLPIFFAGLIFSSSFCGAADPAAAFGSNLIGATIGGFAEYLGMAFGIHALGYLVLAAYFFSAIARQRSRVLRTE